MTVYMEYFPHQCVSRLPWRKCALDAASGTQAQVFYLILKPLFYTWKDGGTVRSHVHGKTRGALAELRWELESQVHLKIQDFEAINLDVSNSCVGGHLILGDNNI